METQRWSPEHWLNEAHCQDEKRFELLSCLKIYWPPMLHYGGVRDYLGVLVYHHLSGQRYTTHQRKNLCLRSATIFLSNQISPSYISIPTQLNRSNNSNTRRRYPYAQSARALQHRPYTLLPPSPLFESLFPPPQSLFLLPFRLLVPFIAPPQNLVLFASLCFLFF